jgi:hypothetical protein
MNNIKHTVTRFCVLISTMLFFSLNCFSERPKAINIRHLDYSAPISTLGFYDCFRSADLYLNAQVSWVCTVVNKQRISSSDCFGLVNGSDIYKANWLLVLNYAENKNTGILMLSNEDLSGMNEGMLINVEGKFLGTLYDENAGIFLVLAANKITRVLSTGGMILYEGKE